LTARFVSILAVPRTGSSHLVNLLRRCPKLSVKGEIFNRNAAIPPRDAAALARLFAGDGTDKAAVVDWCRSNPASTLETLFRQGGNRPVVFKLLVGHVSKDLIREQLLARDDVRYIVLRRRPIESFISVQKALIVSNFQQVDTTSVKPTLHVDRFVAWAVRVRRWYTWIDKETKLLNLPVASLSYERDIDGKTDDEALSHILHLLQELGLSDIAPLKNVAGAVRQDREQDFQKRVSNWTAFEAELLSVPAHAKLLRWAEASW
jgi:hypothetical protein